MLSLGLLKCAFLELQQELTVILMFFQSQVLLLKQMLADRGFEKVAMSTVDGFQGQESDIIVISCVCAARPSDLMCKVASKFMQF